MYLTLRGITKAFPGVLANCGVNVDVDRGEIHAILGENGAGKSTLMKILYGFYQPDAGTIAIEGRELQIRSPSDAIRAGIGMVFQSFMLIPAFSVLENIALALPDLGVFLSRAEIRRRVRELGETYGLIADPDAKVWQLSVGEQQRVEIVKLLVSGARILILDEPTSVLAPHEVEGLFRILDTLRRDRYTIVFITHKMREVMAIADRITILRKGTVVGSLPSSATTEEDLVYLLLGERTPPTEVLVRKPSAPDQPAVLLLNGVSVPGERVPAALRRVSLDVHSGEILGIAGVTGNGQTELGETILGLRPATEGGVFLDDVDITRWSTRRILEHGVACIPEDPLRMGVAPGLSIADNMILNERRRFMPAGGVFTDWAAIRSELDRRIESFGLSIPRLSVPVGTLSGGNVQRLLLLRELSRRPRLLVAFYPTRGLDIAATRTAHELLMACRNAGTAIVLISEDLDELLALSDRLCVMWQGQVVGTFRSGEVDPVDVGLLMTGASRRETCTLSVG